MSKPTTAAPVATPPASAPERTGPASYVPRDLAERLDIVRARAQRRALLVGGVRLGALLAAAVLVVLALDGLWRPGAGLRVLVDALVLGGALAGGWRWVVRPWRRRPSDAQIAFIVEQALGGFDNRLVNALDFCERADLRERPIARSFARAVVNEARQTARERPLADAVNARAARPWALVFGGALVGLVAFAWIFPAAFGAAFDRYLHPGSDLAAYSATRLAVSPGDTILPRGRDLTIRGVPEAQAPEHAIVVLVDADGTERELALTYSGAAYTATVPNVAHDLTYRVEADDFSSQRYTVTVTEPAALKALSLTLAPPAYTGLPPQTLTRTGGTLRTVSKSRLTLSATTSVDPHKPRLLIDGRQAAGLRVAGRALKASRLLATGRQTWRLTFADQYGFTNEDPALVIEAFTDQPPTIEIVDPVTREAVITPAGALPVRYRVEDDVNVRETALLWRRSNESDWRVVRRFPYETAGTTRLELASFAPRAYGLAAGETVLLAAFASDGAPGHGVYSSPLTVRVIDAEGALSEARDRLAALKEKLRDWRARELALKQPMSRTAGSAKLRSAMWTRLRAKWIATLLEKQPPIGLEVGETAMSLTAPIFQRYGFTRALAALAAGPLSSLSEDARRLSTLGEQPPDAAALAGAMVPVADAVIRAFDELLGLVGKATADLKHGDAGDAVSWERRRTAKQMLNDLSEEIDRFIREQKKTIKTTEELGRKGVDDFSDDDLKSLEQAEQHQDDWAKFFKEAVTDLSKLPDQDFSSTEVAKELVELYQEVQRAAEELQNKSVEMAVPREQAGLELAEELQENLERWLPDTKDTQKWMMEEPEEMPDVPLADLPEELEDIIGELIEGEDDMTDDIEDMSSSWMDSLDAGAGWDAQDGPISNMSAKGVTGNRLPNNSEIGGRSGEGRTGKSSGQFVEQEATGKGGRKTPTRLTPDPYESGNVKDSSKDATGGSTGGGKTSGVGDRGLFGQPPPQVTAKLPRLKSKQAELLQQGQALAHQLKRRNIPAGDLERALRAMSATSDALDKNDLLGALARSREVTAGLKETRRAVRYEAGVRRDRSAQIPEAVKEALAAAAREPDPTGYERLVEEYYRRLAEGK